MLVPLLLLVTGCSAFILDDNAAACWAPTPCNCQATAVQCKGAGLSAVPDFNESDVEYQTLHIYLNDNNIKVIENYSFVNLAATNTTNLIIDLSNNHIMDITNSAFELIQPMVTQLNLENNNLSTLPGALATLPYLNSLNIRRNPIRTLSTAVTFSLSRSVKSLSVSLDLFSAWPREFQYFRLLASLAIDGLQLQRLPLNAFTGFESTLTNLEISHSRLDRIPSVVCHLQKLGHLSYTSNPETKSPIFEPCSRSIASLYFLNMKGNNLTHFPDILNTFVSLDYLDVSENQIRFIDTSIVSYGNIITHLNLSSNYLSRVPSAINHLTELKYLYIANNKVTSLEVYDLVNLTQLSLLQLSDNPLEYISNDAFGHLQKITTLNLSNTNIDVIPRSVASLSGLNRLDVEGAPIQCTCKMNYLKSWASNASRIYGSCEGTKESLSSFISKYVPLCP